MKQVETVQKGKTMSIVPEYSLILASHSSRRRELLEGAGYSFCVLTGSGEEREYSPSESPKEYTRSLAEQKAREVALVLCQKLETDPEEAQRYQSEIVVLGCDSIAVCQDFVLGKPIDRADASRMLHLLNNSVNYVHTGLCLIRLKNGLKNEKYRSMTRMNGVTIEKIISTVETSTLKMEQLTEERIELYLNSGKWQGKAGAFGYQDGNDWLRLLHGSESNVVGLPLERLAILLKEFRLPTQEAQ